MGDATADQQRDLVRSYAHLLPRGPHHRLLYSQPRETRSYIVDHRHREQPRHTLSSFCPVLIRCFQVTGRIVTGAGSEDVFKFLDHTSVIWNKLMGDPRSTERGDYKGKLNGDYVWPVSVEIPPTNVCPGFRPTNEVYDLPQTFLEPNIRASVEYTLSIRISRSMLRADSVYAYFIRFHLIEPHPPLSSLTSSFAYLTISRPPPLSFLRQLAYQENTLLPGPDADPEGWQTSKVGISRGTYQKTRHVVAKCRLSLAKPLCYTRGSSIPILLDIECDERKALDAISSTAAATITLQRRVRYFLACASSARKDVGWKEVVEDVHSIVWWPSVEGARISSNTSRRLDGEIRLPSLLHPTSSMVNFSVTVRTHPLNLVQPVLMRDYFAVCRRPSPLSGPTLQGWWDGAHSGCARRDCDKIRQGYHPQALLPARIRCPEAPQMPVHC